MTADLPGLRRATPTDAPACADLVERAYAVHLPRMDRVPGPMLADYDAVVRDAEVWLAEDATGITGLLVLRPEDGALLLDNLAVRPDRQRSGLGGSLLAAAERRARELGLPAIRLFTHVTMIENQRFYESRGYERVRRDTVDGYDRLFYVKRLERGRDFTRS